MSSRCGYDNSILWQQPLWVLGFARWSPKDKSMEAMIESGEEWMRPMLDYRDLLADTQRPEVKSQLRQYKRRNGQVKTDAEGTPMRWGPYKLTTRKDLLRRLLDVQNAVRREGPNPREELISVPELEAIRKIWRAEERDWEDSVPGIYSEVTGQQIAWSRDEQPGFGASEQKLLEELCRREKVPAGMVAKLLEIERSVHGMSRRTSVHQKIAAVFDEDWRSENQIESSATSDDS